MPGLKNRWPHRYSVLLILKFVVRRAKMLSSVAIPSDVWVICFWLRLRRAVIRMVGLARFVRTGDLEVRNPLLYPSELQAVWSKMWSRIGPKL